MLFALIANYHAHVDMKSEAIRVILENYFRLHPYTGNFEKMFKYHSCSKY